LSVIIDVLNRIRNLILNRKTVLPIEAPSNEDKLLKSSLAEKILQYFEDINHFNEYCKKFFYNNKGSFENQYGYIEIITKMQENGAIDEYLEYLKYVKNNSELYYPSKVHGIDHTSRVLLFAEMLCMLDNISDEKKNLIMVAAQLHDIGREDDLKQIEHGKVGKEKIEKLELLRNFNEKDRKIIEFAVECHSLSKEQKEQRLKLIPRKDRKEYKLVLDYLQDADKLDRTRIANKEMGLDPNRLTTDTAKKLVKLAHQNYYEYFRMMEYQSLREETKDLEPRFLEAFVKIRESGYNITMEFFKNIVSEYRTGTLQMLMQENRINDIFSYTTFKEYRKLDNFRDKINENKIYPEVLFNEITATAQVPLLRKTFDDNFMLYYNLKKNNQESFCLLCYVNLDISIKTFAGIVEVMNISDVEKLKLKNNLFRLNDLCLLAGNLTPEQYIEIINGENIQDLYSSKYAKKEEMQFVKQYLENININIDVQVFHEKFRLIEYIIKKDSKLLLQPGIEKYSYEEIFTAITKLEEVDFRSCEKEESGYETNNVIDLIEYSRSTKIFEKIFDDEDQIDIVKDFIENKEYVKNPRYIDYLLKKNKPYLASNIDEIINYISYCSNRILQNPSIELKNAKSQLLNALFEIECPIEYKKEFEKEFMDSLYYHKKYLSDSDLEKNSSFLMEELRKIFEANDINEFKELLRKNKDFINCYNTSAIGKKIRENLSEFSKKDIFLNLQETAKKIEEMEEEEIILENGKIVKAKVFSGEEFNLAISTVMPECSGIAYSIRKEHGEEVLRNIMLERPINSKERCVGLISNEFLGHAGSISDDMELKYGYIPRSSADMSIMAIHDMSTSKEDDEKRKNKGVITPRSYKDIITGTTEEHNETVMDGYPRYIICFDKISEIAIKKKEILEKEYKEKGIEQPIEILLIKAKEIYIPRIKEKVQIEHSNIKNKIIEGTFGEEDFSKMFKEKESNFVLRSLQAIHTTSFKEELWSIEYVRNTLDSTIDILDRVSEIISPEKKLYVLNMVNLLLDRADKSKRYGTRYYDHTYRNQIDTEKLIAIKKKIKGELNIHDLSMQINEDTIKKY